MIIGLTGKKGCGKSTAARLIAYHEHFSGLGFGLISFAEPLKNMAHLLLRDLGIDTSRDLDKAAVLPVINVSPRRLYQTLGTEWGRHLIHPDLWVFALAGRLKNLNWPHIVIDDVRFENEAGFIRAQGGLIIHIDRPCLADDDPHESETGIAFQSGDERLVNNHLDDFLHQFKCLVESKLPVRPEREAVEGRTQNL